MDNIFDDLQNNLKSVSKRLADGFIENFDVDQITRKILNVDDEARRVVKTFGQGKEFIEGIKRSLTDANEEVVRLGGNFREIVDIQVGVSAALGRNLIMVEGSYDKLFAATKITDESARTIIESFKNAGISAYNSSQQIENIVNISRRIGVNAELVTTKVLNNLGELNKYNFKGGVEGLAKMAAQATNLRIDMRESFSFAERVYNPEGAIETAAALQRLGVAQSDLLDPLRLMELSQNDPAELQNQLVEMSKQFVKLNEQGRFEIMPGEQRRLREISKELDIGYDQLTKMAIGASELDDKMRKISFPTDIDEDTQKLIANMAEMKGDEYKIKFEGEDMGLDEVVKIAQTDRERFEKFVKSVEPKTLEELQSEQLSVSKSIDANIKAMADKTAMGLAPSTPIDDILNIAQTASNTISKFVTDSFGSNKNIRDNTDALYTEIIGGLKGLIKGEESFETIGNRIGKVAETMETQLKDNFLTATTNASDSLKELEKSGNGLTEVINSIIGKLPIRDGDNPDQMEDFIKLPGQVIQPLPQDTLFGGTGFEEMMGRISSITNTQKGETTSTSTPTNRNTTADINVNFKIDAPPQIDTNQLMLMLNTNDFKQTIIKTVADAFSPDETSPSKKMNSFART
jgi:hypothetical protein